MDHRAIVKAIVFIIGATSVCAHAASSWQPMVSPTSVGLRGVWGTNGQNLFAVGAEGTILHYDGDGNNDGHGDNIWEQMSSPTTEVLTGVWGSADNDIWAVGSGGMILRRQNYGAWQQVAGIATDIGFNDVWGSGPGDVYVVGQYASSHGAILHWDGTSMVNVHGPVSGPLGPAMQFNAVWGRSGNDVFVVGHNGYSNGLEGVAYRYNGTTWQWEWSGTGWPRLRTLYSAWGDDEDLFVAGQSYGGPSDWFAEAAHYDGDTSLWSTEVFTDAHAMMDVSGTSQSNVYTVGYNGKIIHYDGSLWQPMDSGTTQFLSDIWIGASGDAFVVGDGGTILRLPATVPAPSAIALVGIGIGLTSKWLRRRGNRSLN